MAINLKNGQPIVLDRASMLHGGLNPLGTADFESISALLRNVCSSGLRAEDQSELDDQIEAIVPALVELRDAGHLSLNFAVLASYSTLHGFTRLADDERLTSLSRARCAAMRNRMVALGVKALLGHL